MSAWIVVDFEGIYTQGKPAPSEIHALAVVDRDHTLIDVEIENATTLLLYSINRDENAIARGTGTIDPNSSSGSNSNANSLTSEEANAERNNNLNFTRNTTTFLLFALVLCDALLLFRFSKFSWIRTLVWFSLIIYFTIIIPMTYVSDMGGIQRIEYGMRRDYKSMVHIDASDEINVVPFGFEMEYEFGGYDLGLVEPDNRSAVIANPPPPESQDANSWIQFEANLTLKLGKNLHTLVFFPIVWFFIPSFPSKKYEDNIENEKNYPTGNTESE